MINERCVIAFYLATGLVKKVPRHHLQLLHINLLGSLGITKNKIKSTSFNV